jgi:hypothetical protein
MSCKGYKHTKEDIELIRLSKLGENNPMWKGDKAKKTSSFHRWIEYRKPKPELCEKCKKNKSYDLANISGEYKRDINDFEWLCRSCHMKEDNRIFELHKIMVNKRKERTLTKFNKAKVLLKEGKSYNEISQELGYINRSSLWGLLHNKKYLEEVNNCMLPIK